MVTVPVALHDLRSRRARATRAPGSVYVVKPKMHGPEEVAFADEIFDARRGRRSACRATPSRSGIMDEERRTSANLAECIRAAQAPRRLHQHRLPRPHRRRDPHLDGSRPDGPQGRDEERRLDQGLRGPQRRHRPRLRPARAGRRSARACGRCPTCMADMLEQKIAHPQAGANRAWVPSPTAATLHATHYHRVDVAARQEEIARAAAAPRSTTC